MAHKLPHRIVTLFLALILLLTLAPAHADSIPFTDVASTDWYYEPVCWAYEIQAVSGTSPNTFSPNMVCSRAQIVTILWGLSGRPVEDWENPFTDVSPDSYYYNAVLWAKETGVTAGITPDSFAPDMTCTRAQAMTFIWKYFGGEIVPPEVQYDDIPADAYFYNSVNWAFSNGVTAGTGGNGFSPNVEVTRAMVVTFLYRMRHVLEGGQHSFVLSQELEADCLHGPGKVYTCACGNSKTVYSGVGLGHDFCQARLVADATYYSPTIYQLCCIRCGMADGQGNRSLGKPILREPQIQSKLRTHVWTAEELANGIHFQLSNGGEATITRRWFGNAWCYITHAVLPLGAYTDFTGTNVFKQFGSNDPSKYLSAYDEMAYLPEAQILFNGDTQLWTGKATLRGNCAFLEKPGWSATYWNPSLGTYGTVSSLGRTDVNSLPMLQSLGVTDTFYFSVPYVQGGRMWMDLFDQQPDYWPESYTTRSLRRQASILGFKTEGNTIHIYRVCSDGCTYTNYDSSDPYNFANDRASYGNTKREMMILISTLGVDYATALDGGWSSALIIRRNGVVEQVNAADFSLKTGYSPYEARKLWDFLYFK